MTDIFSTKQIALALIVVFIIICIYAIICLCRKEKFSTRDEKAKELYNWFNKNGGDASYGKFKSNFKGKKADVVDYEIGREALTGGKLSPDVFK